MLGYAWVYALAAWVYAGEHRRGSPLAAGDEHLRDRLDIGGELVTLGAVAPIVRRLLIVQLVGSTFGARMDVVYDVAVRVWIAQRVVDLVTT